MDKGITSHKNLLELITLFKPMTLLLRILSIEADFIELILKIVLIYRLITNNTISPLPEKPEGKY